MARIRYRNCVAGIIENAEGLIWVGERQFPQGGVDPGEARKAAVLREIREETGIRKKDLEVLEKRKGYRYKFHRGRTKWGVYRGQEQSYYLLRYTGKDSSIDIKTPKPEFRAWRWVRPEDYELNWLPSWKQKVYSQVWIDFFGIHLPEPSSKRKA